MAVAIPVAGNSPHERGRLYHNPSTLLLVGPLARGPASLPGRRRTSKARMDGHLCPSAGAAHLNKVWGRAPEPLCGNEHYARDVVDVKGVLPHIVILHPLGRIKPANSHKVKGSFQNGSGLL